MICSLYKKEERITLKIYFISLIEMLFVWGIGFQPRFLLKSATTSQGAASKTKAGQKRIAIAIVIGEVFGILFLSINIITKAESITEM